MFDKNIKHESILR